jgi:malate dehydrogenase
MPKVSIIGAGNVGSTTALNIVSKQLADIVLLDINTELAIGKSMDLQDYQSSINGCKSIIGTSDYSLISDSDVIVISAGRARRKGETITREDLAEINSEIIKGIAVKIKEYSPNSIVLTITNPLDKMNLLGYKESGINRKKVIGVGGLLDTARLKIIISKELNVPVTLVDAVIKGPHNNDMIPCFSCAKVNGKPVSELISSEKLNKIKQKVRSRGAEVTKHMGSGYYAIGNVTSQMVESILLDKKELMTVSVCLEGEYGINGVSIGVLIRLGKDGAEIVEVDFSEKKELIEAAEKMGA